MERLVDRFIRGEMAVSSPLHPNQHAYQAGNSTEMALHQLIVQVEKVLDQQETALGVFLDIEGHLTTSPMTPSLPRWLDMRSVTPSYDELGLPWRADGPLRLLGGLQKYRGGQGLPTERRTFPLLWSLVVDELLTGLNQEDLRSRICR
jgi:hypothetical protein